MFQNTLIFVAVCSVAAVAGSAIPLSAGNENGFEVTYEGNNLIVGNAQDDQISLRSISPVWKWADRNGKVTHEVFIIYQYDAEILEIRTTDQAASQELGALPQLIHGGPGQNIAVLLFTSKAGQPIRAEVTASFRLGSAIPLSAGSENGFGVTYEGNNLIVGNAQDDQISLRSISPVWKLADRNGKVTHQVFTIYQYDAEILEIRTTDQAASQELGAFPQLIHGGPGQNIAVLLFTSKAGQPIRAEVGASFRLA